MLSDILYELNQARIWTLDRISVLTGVNKLRSIVIVVIVLIEILIFLVVIPLHRSILKKLMRAKQSLVQYIDEIIYQLATTQYASHISKKELGWDPHLAMMQEMFKSGHFEYLDNISIIKENVGKVELLLEKQVVTPEQRLEVAKLQRKMKRLIFRSKAFGYVATFFTVGLYKIFW